jgi:hypothetical protein
MGTTRARVPHRTRPCDLARRLSPRPRTLPSPLLRPPEPLWPHDHYNNQEPCPTRAPGAAWKFGVPWMRYNGVSGGIGGNSL